jgi:putative cell wall-binding protein
MVRAGGLRVTGVVAVTAVGILVGATVAASEPAPPLGGTRQGATTANSVMTWDALQDDRRVRAAAARPDSDTFSVPGPRAALLQRVRRAPRVGAAPSAAAVSSVDGPVTVQHGSSVRSIDPATGAVSSQRLPTDASLPTWGPAGDRLLAVRGGTNPHLVLTDEDGASNRVDYGSDDSVARPRVPLAWSPFGDSATMATSAPAGVNYQLNPYAHGWYFHTGAHVPEVSPTVNGYGDLVVTKWSEPAADPSLPRRHGLTVTRGSYPDGRQPSGPTVDISTGPYTDFGAPAIGLAPGGSVLEQSEEYLALPVRLPASAGGPGLYVDHADGQGLVRVAALGAVCSGQQFAFSPGHTRLAYLEAVGPAGAECSRTRLWVMDAEGARYGGRAPRLVADSGSGAPFSSMSWKARTPAPFAGRVAGVDRIATGIAASRVLFTDRAARTAVVAGAQAFPDALAATPLAGRLGGPLLLSKAGGLDNRVAAELVRAVAPGATVFLVGGPGVLGSAVEKAVAAKGFRVVRLAGADRFETAVRIARHLDANDPRPATWPNKPVLVADGAGFSDALVAGPAASHWFGTVVLTNGSRLPAVTRAYLKDVLAADGTAKEQWLNAIGGSAVRAVEGDAATRGKVDWIAGTDRYQTAEYVARTFFWAPSVAGMADGRNWPDAVTGGTAMAHLGMPLLLVNGSSTPAPTEAWWRLTRSATDAVVAFGGAAVVPDARVRHAQQLGGSQTPLWGPDLL